MSPSLNAARNKSVLKTFSLLPFCAWNTIWANQEFSCSSSLGSLWNFICIYLIQGSFSSKVKMASFYFLELKTEKIQISVVCCAPAAVIGRGLTLEMSPSYIIYSQRVMSMTSCLLWLCEGTW